MRFTVIGLSGKAGSGKDFIFANYLAPLGFKQFALAWHFKVWLIGKGKATYEEVFRTKPARVRHLLQQEGTELGRNVYGQNVWPDTMFTWFKVLNESWGLDKFCVSDVRFPNEMEAVQDWGGKVIRIVAPKREAMSGLSAEARQHISETALDAIALSEYDAVIRNDPGDDVESQIRELRLDAAYEN